MPRRPFGRVFKRGRKYYIRFRVKGIENVQPAGPTRKVAVDLLADIQAKIAKEEALGVRTLAKASLLEAWEKAEPGRRARLTRRALKLQRDHVTAAAEFFGGKAVRDLEPADIEEFLVSLRARGLKPSTLNRVLTSISSVLAEAVEFGLAKENVAGKVKRHREDSRPVPFLGESEIRLLIAAASADLRPIVAILADTGLRRGELLALEWSDVDLSRAVVIVRRSKTGRGREVPLTARARGAFESLEVGRAPRPLRGGDPVFASLLTRERRPGRVKPGTPDFTDQDRAEALLSKRFSRLARSLGMVGTSLHGLRHSCASRMVAAGAPLSFVAKVTGHSTLTCAARYGHHAPEDAARQAIRLLEAAGAMPPPPRKEAARG